MHFTISTRKATSNLLIMTTSKTLIFFGNERLVSGLTSTNAPILTALIENGYKIAAVVSHHSDGQSRNNRELEVAKVAAEHNIPVLLPKDPIDILDKLRSMNAEAAILVAYGRLIPQSIIDIFPKGIINIHPSLLPKYRGPTPIESAIENGDLETGTSIMRLSAGMDEGPIYAQTTIPLRGSETKFDLYDMEVEASSELLLKVLPSILDGSLEPSPQPNDHATYSKLLTKADGILDPTSHTATECERLIRAHLGFPKTKTTALGHDIIITKAHVAESAISPLDMSCKDGSTLSIDELIAPSGRTMSASAFLNGYAAG
ncbi:methionyl-tRNA formyltransferase [Patescibacteria group bacterium]|nr:MAG: methionyl-tRNA formyltransferase [Patescibacteria group bacterium]